MTDPVYLRMAVIGSGLIGSSVARAARASGAVGEIDDLKLRPETMRVLMRENALKVFRLPESKL